jgi:archaemetzincin
LRRALDFDALVEPLPRPGPHDWLAVHEERGQTFDAFQPLWPMPETAGRPILIQPIDDVLVDGGDWLEHLVRFTGAFFLREVEVLPTMRLQRGRIRSRQDRAIGAIQYFAGDVVLELAARRRPDAMCLVGLTSHDIYPDMFVEFAFGVASSRHRVALCSTARYGPPFDDPNAGQPSAAIFRRCMRLLSHEICHVLGMGHCIYAHCLMNGSANLVEGDRRPLHLCPVDLRKLQLALGFNGVDHFRRLWHFWCGMADDPEARWITQRLRHVLEEWRPEDEARQACIAPEP